MARVNQSCLTADIWLRAECSNTIPDISKCQPNQLRDAREWRNKMVQEGGARRWRGVNFKYTYSILLKVKGHSKSTQFLETECQLLPQYLDRVNQDVTGYYRQCYARYTIKY